VATRTQDDAVRTYLQSLQDPQVLVDKHKVKQVDQQLTKESDPLKRLELHEQKRRLDDPNEAKNQAKEAFVKHAKAWADENGVTVASFAGEGVPAVAGQHAGAEQDG
jgi:type I restriction-modification system DNA methylase subunit